MSKVCSPALSTGAWRDDKRHGFGRCKFADGARFAGRWEDDGWVQSMADAARSGVAPQCLPLRSTAGADCCFTIQVLPIAQQTICLACASPHLQS